MRAPSGQATIEVSDRADGAPSPVLAIAEGWSEFDLLDTGAGKKLERYGNILVVRPEPQAMWRPALAADAWERADAEFVAGNENGGRWRFARSEPAPWKLHFRDLGFLCRFTSFRHLGIFPEQSPHWDWMRALLQSGASQPRVLNLFAYTGAASLAAACCGASVTHVDSSKKAIAWARENQALQPGRGAATIRWICDDALKFVRRERRRNARYDGVILDPPKFGRGAKGEVWKLNEHLTELLQEVRHVLSAQPLFIILTAYGIQASHLHLYFLMHDVFGDLGGRLQSGELALRERSAGRLLPTALFCRWSPGVAA